MLYKDSDDGSFLRLEKFKGQRRHNPEGTTFSLNPLWLTDLIFVVVNLLFLLQTNFKLLLSIGKSAYLSRSSDIFTLLRAFMRLSVQPLALRRLRESLITFTLSIRENKTASGWVFVEHRDGGETWHLRASVRHQSNQLKKLKHPPEIPFRRSILKSTRNSHISVIFTA